MPRNCYFADPRAGDRRPASTSSAEALSVHVTAEPLSATADSLWSRTLDLLREEGKHYALSWLERMRALELRDGALVLGVPDRFFRDWVDDHYRSLLEDAL